jgi:hypothetical protein
MLASLSGIRFTHAVEPIPDLRPLSRLRSEPLVLQLDRDVDGLIRKVWVALLRTNLLEQLLKSRPSSHGPQTPLDPIHPSVRMNFPPYFLCLTRPTGVYNTKSEPHLQSLREHRQFESPIARRPTSPASRPLN